jgi:hypothetical protein
MSEAAGSRPLMLSSPMTRKEDKPGRQEPDGSIVDEPGMAERFQRALRKALNTPPKHRPTKHKSKVSGESKSRSRP